MDTHPLAQPAAIITTLVAVSVIATCRQCRAVLEADRLGDKEECALRDHLLVVHPNTIRAETLGVLLKHFVVTEQPPPVA